LAKAEFPAGVGAAPHLPAGILSPYSDGERGAFMNGFANHKRGKKSANGAAGPFLPVTIRGEMSGRTMRGCAGFDNHSETIALETSPETVIPFRGNDT
jgi:hypothetical protein